MPAVKNSAIVGRLNIDKKNHKPDCIQDKRPKRKSILTNFLTFNRVVYVKSLSQIADISWRVAYKKDQDDSQKDHGQVILLFPPGLRTVIRK